jgi:immunoglobulin-binding protein 1
LQLFLRRVHHYDIIPEDERKLYSKKSAVVRDPARKRELKIKQFKADKELRGRLEASSPTLDN